MTEQTAATETKSESHRLSWIGILIFFSGCAIVILFAAFGFAYFELAKVNVSLASMVTELRTQTDDHQTKIKVLAQSVTELQQGIQKSRELSEQQEKLVTEWRAVQAGNLEKWQVVEAQSLVKLANDHLQFENNTPIAITLLQRAEQSLQKIETSQVIAIRKSLASDISNLQALAPVDITSLYLSLTGMTQVLQSLPLRELPLKSETKSISLQEEPKQSLSWWRRGLEQSLQALQKIVVVRYTGANAQPLVLPEEKVFLYQNLQAQLESAIWGLLHRNAAIYQNSLARMQEWIEHYYDQKAQTTQSVIQTLQTLQKVDLKLSKVSLDATIQLFDQYFSQTGTSS